MSSGWTRVASSSAPTPVTASYSARSAAPSGPPSPGASCSRLCRRLVSAKKAGRPSSTIQRVSTPTPRV